MHELSILQEVLDVALAQAKAHQARAIHRVRLQVGALSGVVPEALSFAFPTATKGTLAEGATLDVELVPVVAHCPNCDCEFEPLDVVYLCPVCGSPSSDIRQGEELCLHSLEISFDAK